MPQPSYSPPTQPPPVSFDKQPTPGVPPAPAAKPPLYKRSWFIVVVALAVLGIIGSAVSQKDDDTRTSSSSREESTSVEQPASTAPAAPSVAATVPSADVPVEAQAPVATTFAMPDFVGMDLQSAQDLVQANGPFLSYSHDLLGSRNQMVDSNWIVCDQNIPVGDQVATDAEGLIDFGVVKREERCP